jgi:hypothetical protein
MVSSLAIRMRILYTPLQGNEAPAASVQVLHIREGEEPPEPNDARVRLASNMLMKHH